MADRKPLRADDRAGAILDAIFLQALILQGGVRDPKPIEGGRYAAIVPKMFTTAIVAGRMGDLSAYEDNWCYRTYPEAKAALDAWDGTGEPDGWHRHTPSGRRVSLSPDEYDDAGKPVGAIGVRYRRP